MGGGDHRVQTGTWPSGGEARSPVAARWAPRTSPRRAGRQTYRTAPRRGVGRVSGGRALAGAGRAAHVVSPTRDVPPGVARADLEPGCGRGVAEMSSRAPSGAPGADPVQRGAVVRVAEDGRAAARLDIEVVPARGCQERSRKGRGNPVAWSEGGARRGEEEGSGGGGTPRGRAREARDVAAAVDRHEEEVGVARVEGAVRRNEQRL